MSTSSTTPTRSDTTTRDALLRLALRLDATLSGLCGIAVAAFANPLADLTGLTPTQGYVVGALMVLYGVVVYRLAALESLRGAGIGVMTANIVGTIGAVLLVVDDLVPLTGAGVGVVLACAVYTAFFAGLQYAGLRRLR